MTSRTQVTITETESRTVAADVWARGEGELLTGQGLRFTESQHGRDSCVAACVGLTPLH